MLLCSQIYQKEMKKKKPILDNFLLAYCIYFIIILSLKGTWVDVCVLYFIKETVQGKLRIKYNIERVSFLKSGIHPLHLSEHSKSLIHLENDTNF